MSISNEKKFYLREVISVLLIMVPTCYFGWIGQLGEQGFVLLAGTLAATFINLDKFQKVRAGNIELLLTQAKEAAEEAKLTIENFKRAIEPILSMNLNSITYMGRLNAGDDDKYKDKIIESLSSLISEYFPNNNQLKEQLDQIVHYKIWDAYSYVTYAYEFNKEPATINGQVVLTKVNADLCKELNELRDYSKNIYPSVDNILNLFSKYDIEVDDKVKKSIENYRNVLECKKSLYNRSEIIS